MTLPSLPPPPSARDMTSPLWQRWFHALSLQVTAAGQLLWNQLILPTESTSSAVLISPYTAGGGQAAFRPLVHNDLPSGIPLNLLEYGQNINALGTSGQVIGVDPTGTYLTFVDGANMALAIQVVQASPTVLYKGTAAPGSALSAAVWSIQQITLDTPAVGDVSILWANGNSNPVNIWNNYASLTYS